jgi:hypothetical protein
MAGALQERLLCRKGHGNAGTCRRTRADERHSCASQTPPRCCSQPSASTICALLSGSGAAASSRCVFPYAPLPARRMLTVPAVVPPCDPPLHDPPPSAHPHLHPPPAYLRPPQLPPRWPGPDHLRPPRQLLRRHTLHVPLQDRALLLRTPRRLVRATERCADGDEYLGQVHHIHLKGNHLPPAAAARPLAAAGIFARRCGWLGDRHGVQARRAALCEYLACAGVDGGRGEEEGL